MKQKRHEQFSGSALPMASFLVAAALALGWVSGSRSAGLAPQTQEPASLPSYSAQVEPILKSKCLTCHSAAAKMGGLVLETYDSLLKGGVHGPAITPSRSSESRLLLMLEGKIQPRMPFGADPLPAADIATLKAWIDAGARGPVAGEALEVEKGEKGKRKKRVTGKRAKDSLPPFPLCPFPP